MEEIYLIDAAKKGDKEALSLLIANNINILKGYCVKLTSKEDLADEILQETLLKAIVNLHKFVPKAKFSTWLIKIATNNYLDYLRKLKKYSSEEIIYESSNENIEDRVLNSIAYKEVVNILHSLSSEKRIIFILKHYYGYSYEEISNIVDCPLGTVRSRLHYSVKYILKELEKRRVFNDN